MQYGLTVEVHPSINPLSESEWQCHFPDRTEPKAVARMTGNAQSEYLSIVVKSADKPILLLPLLLKETGDLGLIESVVSDASGLLLQCGSFLGELFTSVFYGRRVDNDRFQNSYVVIAAGVVPGSTMNKEALDQAFRVYASLAKTMPVVLMGNPEHSASMVKVAHAENLI